MAKICVFCSSSPNVPSCYTEVAKELGGLIGQRGHELIYGGSDRGMMGVLANAARAKGSRVTGVRLPIFEGLNGNEHQVIIADDIRTRKAKMTEMSDAFIALAGGFGTLDEIADAVVARLLGSHAKPLALVDTNGFYRPFQIYVDSMRKEGFLYYDASAVYTIAGNPLKAMDHIESELALSRAPVVHPLIRG